MEQRFISQIANTLSINPNQVVATLTLLNEGATIPFISRYRKEKTGELDEVQIASIRDISEKIIEIEKRREFILKTIQEQGNLAPELEKKILEAQELNTLEDIYLPYKPKRKTKATIARDKGLEPLANQLFEQRNLDVGNIASTFINVEKEVNN